MGRRAWIGVGLGDRRGQGLGLFCLFVVIDEWCGMDHDLSITHQGRGW